MLGRLAPHKGMREFGHDTLVQSIAKVFNGWISFGMQNDGFVIVRTLTLWFGVDAKHVTAAYVKKVE
jgi:hypothetical protein